MAASPEKKQKTEEDAKEDEKKEDMKVEEEPEAKALGTIFGFFLYTCAICSN
jgi:hypothetical protein